MKHFVLALVCGLGWAPAVAQPFVLPMHETPGKIAPRADAGAAGQWIWAAHSDLAR